MKNLIVANHGRKSTCSRRSLETYIRAQLDNSLALGWDVRDLALITNFEFEYRRVGAQVISLNSFCITGSKLFAVSDYLENSLPDDEIVWCHDLDLWQNVPFNFPKIEDIGIGCYSNSKFNGGGVFYRKSALDLVKLMTSEICSRGSEREEPIINNVLKRKDHRHRVTVLNHTYNVGCSGYRERYSLSELPIKGVHFHPTNRIAWDTHARNRCGIGTEATISENLRSVLLAHFGDTISKYAYEDGLSPFEIRPTGVAR